MPIPDPEGADLPSHDLDRPWARDSVLNPRLRERASSSRRRADTLRRLLVSASATVSDDAVERAMEEPVGLAPARPD